MRTNKQLEIEKFLRKFYIYLKSWLRFTKLYFLRFLYLDSFSLKKVKKTKNAQPWWISPQLFMLPSLSFLEENSECNKTKNEDWKNDNNNNDYCPFIVALWLRCYGCRSCWSSCCRCVTSCCCCMMGCCCCCMMGCCCMRCFLCGWTCAWICW